MKFKQYILNEEISDKNLEFIKKYCKPYIDLVKKYDVSNVFLYRGIKEINNFNIKKVRKNRKPKDMNIFIHRILDELFFKKFGWRARSNSLFCSPNERTVSYYGKLHIVIPIGKFDYLWSPKVIDLQIKISILKIGKIFNNKTITLKSANEIYNEENNTNFTLEEFHNFLVNIFDSFIKLFNYQKNQGFKEMMDNYPNEVMINCNRYIISDISNFYRISNEIFK